ncbi:MULTISPECIES: MBL fold metallo-hydrolase [unclassified Schlesneria]|uniref:MBL fold metallo-hydrolase n=1 Tax=Schlesneria TaxID=656899 RepID=UPI0035A01637
MMNPHRLRVLLVGMLTAGVLLGVSSFAMGLLVPTETTVTEVAPGVWFRKAQWKPDFIGCNQGWIIFDDFVLVIEASFPNQAEVLIKEIRKTTDKPIKYVFDTHWHGDHADGNPVLIAEGASAIAAESAREQFVKGGVESFEQQQKAKPEEYGKLKYGIPSVYFPKKMILEDAKQRVELIHFGHGHTAGDAVAWLPKHGILFTGDSCVNGAFNYTGESNTSSWISVLTEMAKLPVQLVCPGHGDKSDAKLIETQRRYFVELRQAVQEGIDAGKSLDEIKKKIDLPWYKEWTGSAASEQTENIEHVYKELTRKT